jgi:hypothetical protein
MLHNIIYSLLNLNAINPEIQNRLKGLFQISKSKLLWKNDFSDHKEYLANGVGKF